MRRKTAHSMFLFTVTGAPVMPVWVLIVLIALAEIFVGVVFYFALRQMILTKSYEPMNTYQAAPLEDISNN